MLTTDDSVEFLTALKPGDALIFQGNDPFDRQLQWIDGSSYNHVGVYLGYLGADEDPEAAEPYQTIHAGLSSRSLSAEDKEQLFGDKGSARRHGTIWLVPLPVLLDARGHDEVGGGLQFDAVTAVRWHKPLELDTTKLADFLLNKMDPQTTAPVFDFSQLVNLAEFWIKRAYIKLSDQELLPKLTLDLFADMKPRMKAQADMIVSAFPPPEAGQEAAEVTTCSRLAFDAYEHAGGVVDIQLRKVIEPHVPHGMTTRDWVTPNDIMKSASFTPIIRWTRHP